MIKLIPITISALTYYVRLSFEGDNDLLKKYHISPGDLEHCVEHTMNFIKENYEYYGEDMNIFVVLMDTKVIGYTITIKNEKAPNELYSFGINIKYRKKDILKGWIEKVKEFLGNHYYIVLWSKNTRAIDFFEKNGCVVDRERKMLGEATKTLIVSRSATLI